MNRRQVLELFGLSVVLGGCNSSSRRRDSPLQLSTSPAGKLTPVGPSFGSPCSALDLNDARMRDIAINLVALGGWGFQSAVTSAASAIRHVTDSLLAGSIDIEISVPPFPCSAGCAGPLPTLVRTESANVQDVRSIHEGFASRFLILNALCTGSAERTHDYAIAVTPTARSGARDRFVLVMPSQEIIAASDGSTYAIQSSPSCFADFGPEDLGTAVVDILAWPHLSGAFLNAEPIDIMAVNVEALCRQGDCTEQSVFSVCVGAPFHATYFDFFSSPF